MIYLTFSESAATPSFRAADRTPPRLAPSSSGKPSAVSMDSTDMEVSATSVKGLQLGSHGGRMCVEVPGEDFVPNAMAGWPAPGRHTKASVLS